LTVCVIFYRQVTNEGWGKGGTEDRVAKLLNQAQLFKSDIHRWLWNVKDFCHPVQMLNFGPLFPYPLSGHQDTDGELWLTINEKD